MGAVYEVGRFYRVPCVTARYYGINGNWPVLGEFHEDAEHIRFAHWHYHVDVRFLSKALFEQLSQSHSGPERQYFARIGPVMVNPNRTQFTKTDHPKPVLLLRRCARMYEYSPAMGGAPWIKGLEGAYCDRSLAKGHCPHRGTDLSTMPPDRFGCVECPLHGLVFHVETGKMVPREQWVEWHQTRRLVTA